MVGLVTSYPGLSKSQSLLILKPSSLFPPQDDLPNSIPRSFTEKRLLDFTTKVGVALWRLFSLLLFSLFFKILFPPLPTPDPNISSLVLTGLLPRHLLLRSLLDRF